jgi:acyl carrier protein
MIDPILHSELADTVRSIARIPSGVEIAPESRLVEDLGIDSLDLVSIVLTAQELYGVAIDEDEVSGLRTMSDLVVYVDRRRNAAAA